MSRLPSTSPRPIYKNLMCSAFGLLIVFATSIFVVQDYFSSAIDTMIGEASLLKDDQFTNWGQFPTIKNAKYEQQIVLYDYSDTALQQKFKNGQLSEIKPRPTEPLTFSFNYKYNNVTFLQGSTGRIRYLDKWNLKLINTSLPLETSLTTINLGSQAVFYNDYYAPTSRHFTIAHNLLMESLSNEFRLQFYSEYLHGYYFFNFTRVAATIYKKVGIPDEKMIPLFEDKVYGWKEVSGFKKWMNMFLSKSFKSAQEYQQICSRFSLPPATVDKMVGKGSILSDLMQALHGAIKFKVQASKYGYVCDPMCSAQDLMVFQLTTGMLTNQPLFATYSLKKMTNQFNTSIPIPIQYVQFCKDNGLNPLGNYQNLFLAFDKNLLSNFSAMSDIIRNLNNPTIIENIFGLQQGESESIIQYIKYLKDNLYNIKDGDSIDEQAFKHVITYFHHTGKKMNQLQDLLWIQLHSRAFYFRYNNSGPCQDYFKGDYSQFSSLCLKKETSPVDSLEGARYFVSAYLFKSRQLFLNQTSMESLTGNNFFRLDLQNSLFAQQMKDLVEGLHAALNCESICFSHDLLVREWSGSNSILSSLPTAFFPSPSVTLTEWDVNDVFNKLQPQYWKIIGQTLTIEEANTLLGPSGISNLWSLMKMYHNKEQKVMRYVNKIVVDTDFNGVFTKHSLKQLIQGFQSSELKYKKDLISLQTGGAPWLKSKVSLVALSSSPTRLSTINSGIYDQSLLRQITVVDNLQNASSYYTVFQDKYEHVEEILWTNKSVGGTNGLGFHREVAPDQKIQVWLPWASRAQIFARIQNEQSQGYDFPSYKYHAQSVNTLLPIGIQSQNQRSINISSESSMEIDPKTGLTLSFSFKYTTYATLFFAEPSMALPISTTTINYKLLDTAAISSIYSEQKNLSFFHTLAVVLTAVSMGLVVITVIIYCCKKRQAKLQGPGKKSLIDSLMKEEDEDVIKS